MFIQISSCKCSEDQLYFVGCACGGEELYFALSSLLDNYQYAYRKGLTDVGFTGWLLGRLGSEHQDELEASPDLLGYLALIDIVWSAAEQLTLS